MSTQRQHVPSFSAEKRAGELYGHTPTVQHGHSKPAPVGLHPALLALQSGQLGVAFGGAGFGAAYELGAAHMLSNLHCLAQQGTTAVLTAATPVAGTSAGGFVAAACRCSVSYLDVLSALKQASCDLLQHGQHGRMRSTLQPLIDALLPDNAHELCSSGTVHSTARPRSAAAAAPSPAPALANPTAASAAAPHADLAPVGPTAECTVPSTAASAAPAAAAALPPQSAFVLSATRVRGPCPVCWRGDPADGGFVSKADLIDRLLAGAHEPLESDGRCFARRSSKRLVDGGLRLPVPALPGVAYTLIILPMPNQLQGRLWPYRLLMHTPGPAAIAISPGQYRPWPYSKDYKKSNKLVMKPKPPGVLDMLFERGRRDALAWAQHVGLAALLPAAAPQHQAAAAAARGEQAGRGGRLADAADAADQEEHGVWQAVRSLLATPPGELSLMLPVPAELQHML